MNNQKSLLTVFTVVFMLSGFSGLIYESIWSHYLKLMLGHASYAQTLVLAIFMGGMAIGSMLAARWGGRLSNLILWYGAIEALIGIFGLLFHSTFIEVQGFTFNTLIPTLGSPELVNTSKWSIAALLILPQSILLGATFPLLTSGIIRKFPQQPGNTVAKLYFANSFGAVIGILCNSFLILPAVGLPGSVMTAGILNILLAVIVYSISKNDDYPYQPPVTPATNNVTDLVLLTVAGLTGLASFMYEISWIRMLTMVLGGSTHSFEIMLAAFILGLAIGGFWIRKKIDKFKNPIIALAVIQITMGVLAVLTIPLYGKTFELMGFVINALNQTDEGHTLYLISSMAISLVVMLPATICAGTTLPLVTFILMKSKHGDAAIGKVYAWNTVGAIVGVVVASQLVMPLFGLKSVILTGGFIDIALGAVLLWRFRAVVTRLWLVASFTLGSACVVLLVSTTNLDTQKMASSVFRYGLKETPNSSKIVFHEDGKASTVAVRKSGDTVVLLNNGKPDAGIVVSAEEGSDSRMTGDEPTMVLLGVLPYVYSPEAELIANIGMGSGLTAHTALLNSRVARVDTIEIEEQVYHGAKFFGDKVDNIYSDPRSQVIFDDAKTYFAASQTTYDVIISEPPNPWVSGVSGLFTTEFYRETKKYIKDDGVLVQWMHVYELTPELLATIYRALSENFKDVHIYQVSRSDFAFVASETALKADYQTVFEEEGLRKKLDSIHVKSPDDLRFRKLAGKAVLDAVFNSYPVPSNSDFFPVLDYGAGKARFKGETALSITQLHGSKLLKQALNQDPDPDMKVAVSDFISETQVYNRVQGFEGELKEKLGKNFTSSILTGEGSDSSSWIAAYLGTCDLASADPTPSLEISNMIIETIASLFNYYPEAKLAALLVQVQACGDNRINKEAQDWVEVHQAWLNGDYNKVFKQTRNILKGTQIDSRYLNRLLAFNLASQVKLDIKEDLDGSISAVGYQMILKDLELRALLNLAE